MKYLFFFVLVVILVSLAMAEHEMEDLRNEKILSLFNVVSFSNSACKGNNDKNGTCYLSNECSAKGGKSAGSCASGYGVCCIISINCGGTSSDNCTYIEQTNFNKANKLTSNPCKYTICRKSDQICRIRLDFTMMTIANPFTTTVGADAAGTISTNAGATGDCTTDSFTFSSPGFVGSPVICGVNDGQHMIVDASSRCNVLNFQVADSSAVNRAWSIKATQYQCGDHDSLGGPPGCLQYFTGATGKISSFNYPITEAVTTTKSVHLSNQCYSICFRRETNKCSICYASAIAGQKTFGLSKSPNAAAKSGVDTDCISDYIVIPNGVTKADTVANGATTQKFCGRFLNLATNVADETSVCSFSIPFRVDFKTDADEHCTANDNSKNCEAFGSPGGTIGFFLAFNQRAC